MTLKPPTRAMRENPDLNQLKRQAKELLEAYQASSPEALAEVGAYHRTATPETFALHDAQFVLARSYGFESWPKLKAAVDGVTAAKLHQAVEAGDVETAPEFADSTAGNCRSRSRRNARAAHGGAEARSRNHQAAGRIWRRPRRGDLAQSRCDRPDCHRTRARRRRHRSRTRSCAQKTWHTRTVGTNGRHARAQSRVSEWKRRSDDRRSERASCLTQLCSPDGLTLLHRTAGCGWRLVTKWLIERGADINAKSQQGWTPLDHAASGGGNWLFDNERFEGVAQLLFDHGAELSPLSAAALGRWDYLAKYSPQELEAKGILESAVKGNHLDVVQGLLDLGLDPDEPTQVGHPSEQTWSAGGPLFQAVLLNRIEMARLLLQRGANPNANVFTSGSPAYRAYEARNPEMIALVEQYGGWIDPGASGYARQTEIARKMLAGEIDPHLEPNDFSGRTVAEQVLWGGASSASAEIVRMALEHIDWLPDDPRWFWMLWRPLPGHRDLDAQQQADACACFKLILARCGPHHRALESGQTMLHEVIARDHNVGVQLATMLLDAGARLDIRDALLKSTPLGWACRWGRIEIVNLLLARGADPIEADAEPWATPRAWAAKMHRPEILALLERAAAGAG